MRYFGSFTDQSDVFRSFRQVFDGERIIVAAYEQVDYDGRAFVLFTKGRKLFEVHASHCSCNGLEDQWTPEVVTRRQLLARLKAGGKLGCGTEVDEAVQKFCEKMALTSTRPSGTVKA